MQIQRDMCGGMHDVPYSVCCIVLHCVALCRIVLQCVAVRGSVLHWYE